MISVYFDWDGQDHWLALMNSEMTMISNLTTGTCEKIEGGVDVVTWLRHRPPMVMPEGVTVKYHSSFVEDDEALLVMARVMGEK